MIVNEEPEQQQTLAVFDSSFGRMVVELITGKEKYLKIMTYSPKDLRFAVNSIRLDPSELMRLKSFLQTMLKKAAELMPTIPENRLTEDEMLIRDFFIHYMIRRNRIDTRVVFARDKGVGINLQLEEVREWSQVLEEVVSRW